MSDPAPIEPAPRPQMSLVSAGPAEPYRRLAEIFHDVLSEQSLDALLDRIADTLAELIPYEDVHIYEADEAKRELIPVLARSKWADEVMRERFSFGEGITGWAVERREPVLANQAALAPPGLYNHRAFHARLREELTRASAAHGTVALVMLDLDDFKKVNDIYGHGVGDQLLVQVAAVLQASVRTTDAVCRIGGEEFAIILPSGDVKSSVALAERMRDELGRLEV